MRQISGGGVQAGLRNVAGSGHGRPPCRLEGGIKGHGEGSSSLRTDAAADRIQRTHLTARAGGGRRRWSDGILSGDAGERTVRSAPATHSPAALGLKRKEALDFPGFHCSTDHLKPGTFLEDGRNHHGPNSVWRRPV